MEYTYVNLIVILLNGIYCSLESLVNIRASLPVQLNALHHMLVQYDALETGQKEINHWLNNCEEFLSTLKLSKNQGELLEDIEYLKASISWS